MIIIYLILIILKIICNILNLYLKLFIKKYISKLLIHLIQKMNISNEISIELLPLPLKNSLNYGSLYDFNTIKVAVNFLVMRKKKRNIVFFGYSKPKGYNYPKSSIHAEIQALNYCFQQKSPYKYHIYIWKWNKSGKIISKTCCHSCTKIFKKYSFQNNIFTFNNMKQISAITNNPKPSLSNIIY